MSRKVNKRIILCGRACSGKDFFKKYCYDAGYSVNVSLVTRPMREGEVNGYDYHFTSEEEFKGMVDRGELYEHVNFNGTYYGTTVESFNTAEFFIMTPGGIRQLSEHERKRSLIVYFDIPRTIIMRRMEERGLDTKRIESDDLDFYHFSDFDIRVPNPNFDPEAVLRVVDCYQMSNL